MGEERLGELEQALALCQEVDQSFGELHSWLEKIENEIDNCPSVSTGNQRDQLMKQQAHNAVKFNSSTQLTYQKLTQIPQKLKTRTGNSNSISAT